MRIGVLARGLSWSWGGVKNVIDKICTLLPQFVGPQDEIFIFHNAAGHRHDFERPNCHNIYHDIKSPFRYDHSVFPKLVKQYEIDTILCTKNVVPIGLNGSDLPIITIIYDLLYFKLPGVDFQSYPLADRLYMRHFIKRSMRQSSKILAISQHTKNDIHRLFPNVGDNLVDAMHLGIDPDDFQRPDSIPPYEFPYILFTGEPSPRKNIEVVLRALGRISNHIPHKLVITVKDCFGFQNIITLIRKLRLQDRVIFTGEVDNKELTTLYHGAELFVYPSHYEGFGLPPLEAMACRTPVLCSDRSSIPEVVGDAAIAIDPKNPELWATQIQHILGSKRIQQELIDKGQKRIKIFTWEKTVKTVYDAIASCQPSSRSDGR